MYYYYYYKNQQHRPKREKQNCLYIAYATPQAPAPRKIEKQTEGSNQILTAPVNPCNVPVSNTV